MDKFEKIYKKCLKLIEEQENEIEEVKQRFEEYDDVDDMHRIGQLKEGLSCLKGILSWMEEYKND